MGQDNQPDPLFAALAGQLKVPLLQIARLSELSNAATLPRISAISDHALRLVDAYVQVQDQRQIALQLEPITSSAVLYDVATSLQPFAKHLDFELDVDIRGRGLPVMAHRLTLNTMLTILGASLIEASADEEDVPRTLTLGTHRSSRGIVVGVFSSHVPITQRVMQLSRELHGKASQAIPSLGLAGGAGIAIADRLSEQMSAPLKSFRHNSMTGIGTMLMPSSQLQLI
mgnify:CR=1 FL=1